MLRRYFTSLNGALTPRAPIVGGRVDNGENPRAISDLVETPYGFHIIRVDEHMAGRMQTLDEVRTDIRALLTDRAEQEGLSKAIEEARRTAKIEIYV